MSRMPFKIDSQTGLHKPNEFVIDYYTVSVSKEIDLKSIEDMHVPDNWDRDFNWRLCENGRMHTNYGVDVRYFNSDNWPMNICDSGLGTDNFGYFYPRFDEYCRENDIQYRASRFDVAYDMIMTAQEWKEKSFNIIFETYQNDQTKWKVTGGYPEVTLYYGNREYSRFYHRIYNKTLQNPTYRLKDDNGNDIELGDNEYIIRFEVEIKKTKGGDTHIRKKTGETIKTIRHYGVDQYVSDYYSNPKALSALLCEKWKIVQPFGWDITGDVSQLASQNQSFVQKYLVEKEETSMYVAKVFGSHVIDILTHPVKFRVALVDEWAKHGYYYNEMFMYLANPQAPEDLSWVKKFDISPEWLASHFDELKIPLKCRNQMERDRCEALANFAPVTVERSADAVKVNEALLVSAMEGTRKRE